MAGDSTLYRRSVRLPAWCPLLHRRLPLILGAQASRYPRATLGALRARISSVGADPADACAQASIALRSSLCVSAASMLRLAADSKSLAHNAAEPCARVSRGLRASIRNLARKYQEACTQASTCLRLGIESLARPEEPFGPLSVVSFKAKPLRGSP